MRFLDAVLNDFAALLVTKTMLTPVVFHDFFSTTLAFFACDIPLFGFSFDLFNFENLLSSCEFKMKPVVEDVLVGSFIDIGGVNLLKESVLSA